MKQERMFGKGIELFSQEGQEMPILTGYPITFNTYSEPHYSRAIGYYTKFAPESVQDALQDPQRDIRVIRDHLPQLLFGRNCPSRNVATCTYTIDAHGVKMSVQLPNTQDARDLVESLKRGDLDGMSFGCYIGESDWSEKYDGIKVRTVKKFSSIDDFTICTYPVFPSTSVGIRSMFSFYIPEAPPEVPAQKPDDTEALKKKLELSHKRLTLL